MAQIVVVALIFGVTDVLLEFGLSILPIGYIRNQAHSLAPRIQGKGAAAGESY